MPPSEAVRISEVIESRRGSAGPASAMGRRQWSRARSGYLQRALGVRVGDDVGRVGGEHLVARGSSGRGLPAAVASRRQRCWRCAPIAAGRVERQRAGRSGDRCGAGICRGDAWRQGVRSFRCDRPGRPGAGPGAAMTPTSRPDALRRIERGDAGSRCRHCWYGRLGMTAPLQGTMWHLFHSAWA